MRKRNCARGFAWKTILFFVLINQSTYSSNAQIKKWDGGAGDGQWNTASNWSDDILPVAADSVVLDNSFLSGNYNVLLPAGNISTSIRWLVVVPSASIIQIRIPNTNTAVPAIALTGIRLFNGAVFINSSGASSGVVINISDSLYIFNGARFIQNSTTGHAAFVSRLSKTAGTENGTFEFDVPNSTSYTISASGRTYGNLELHSTAAGLPKTYLSGGAQTLTINGTLTIGTGATYSLDFTADIVINGQLNIYGTFNIANNPNNNSIKIKQGYYQYGDLTETSSGLPKIELNGSTVQDIFVSGNIFNSISFKINNSSGAVLLNPLSLPYKLELIQGKITTSSTNLLTLQTGCSIQADSMNQNSFINGPMRKLGLSATANFLFPVGKGITQRWLELKNATGDYTIEFFKIDPHTLSSLLGAGLNHISGIEYWNVLSAGSGSARLELSFDNVNSGGVTDLNSLRASALITGTWTNAGNVAYTGTAGSNGSVISNDFSFSIGQNFFTLGSSQPGQNPLPTKPYLTISKVNGEQFLNWEVKNFDEWLNLSMQSANPGSAFRDLQTIPIVRNQADYSYRPLIGGLYRLRLQRPDGAEEFSNTVVVDQIGAEFELNRAIYSSKEGLIALDISSSKARKINLVLYDQTGRLIRIFQVSIHPGNSQLTLLVNQLPTGIYHIIGLSSPLRTKTLKFVSNP